MQNRAFKRHKLARLRTKQTPEVVVASHKKRTVKPTGRNLRFTRFYIENWKNFQHASVDVERRVFIVGPNASGKSNFLDAFRFLHDIARVGGGFQAAVNDRLGVSAIRNLSARRYPEIVLDATLGNSERKDIWRYELRFTQNNNRIPQITGENIWYEGAKVLTRPGKQDEADPEQLTQTHLEQVNVNKEFREITEAFASVRYLHVIPQLIREPDRSVGRKNDPYGGDFLEILASTPKRTLESRLERIRKALRIAVPQLEELDLVPDARGAWHLRGKYKHWRPQGAWQSEDQFSDGTLRLIGLLWSILDGTGPLLLEEPELSLHAGVVKKLPQMIYRMQRRNDRQVIISTHSAEILDDSGIGAHEVLVIYPTEEGSIVRIGADIDEVINVLSAGEPLSEALIPITTPTEIYNLPLFADQ